MSGGDPPKVEARQPSSEARRDRELGYALCELTLRVYAHALPVEERDLAFADFGSPASGPGRPYAAPLRGTDEANAL